MFDAIRFAGYKSFPSDKNVDIPRLGYINLFIGKNNCGKSSVLDVIGSICQPDYRSQLDQKPETTLTGYRIRKEEIEKLNRRYSTSGYYQMLTHVDELLWKRLTTYGTYNGGSAFNEKYESEDNEGIQEPYARWDDIWLGNAPNNGYYAKISAERNIEPEYAIEKLQLFADGRGATNVIRSIINNKNYDEQLVEVTLLEALNQIMGQDAQFNSIRVQEVKIGKDAGETLWEVFLQERGNKRFPLSQSGSGLKTIILVLLNLIVLPKVLKDHEFFYAFEELENNLHPALQRRLFEFIYDYAVKNETYIFLTTHSHVAINMIFGKEHTALYHVVKKDYASEIKPIENYLDKAEILDDLDVKASDLLQANGIIWVEGPSDRVYIKRWLEVFGGTDIQEGRDYQFAYYGGRLLSHFSAEEEPNDNLINMLLINRNSAIIMDSDKRYHAASVNSTKRRIIKEFSDKQLFSWITKGKEIENYLSFGAINSAFDFDLQKQCGKFELFPEYIASRYKNFSGKKVDFANTIKNHIDSTPVMDLEVQIKKLYQTVKSWNK